MNKYIENSGGMQCGGSFINAASPDILSFTMIKYDFFIKNISLYVSLPAGKTVTVDLGDGSDLIVIEGPQTLYHIEHTYGVSTHTITFSGDIDSITYLNGVGAYLGGDIAEFSKLKAIQTLDFENCNKFEGDIAVFAVLSSLKNINFSGNSVVSGALSSISSLTGLTQLALGNTAVTGNLTDIAGMTQLEYIDFYWSAVAGNVATIAGMTALTFMRLFNNSNITYTTTTLPDWAACSIYVNNCSWDQTTVDDFLIDLAAVSGSSTSELNISGNNAAPSAAGLAAVSVLEGLGWTVTVSV